MNNSRETILELRESRAEGRERERRGAAPEGLLTCGVFCGQNNKITTRKSPPRDLEGMTNGRENLPGRRKPERGGRV